ncbi:DUF4144 family protein [Aliivibrio sp. EL58]|uniref:DUF4144 family protein n=1 Tax=Aliivibrio sp. EL58 TaxID=2107582 RepID=UPI000EFB9B5D|nr:DUF4144 family protein [Aliivibrio sp. EL58]
MVVWPAIVKFEGDSELDYISSESEWKIESELHYLGYQDKDILVDSTGAIFSLNDPINNMTKIISTNKTITMDILLELIKEHQSSLGLCCAAKVGFDSIKGAIESVKES